MNRRGFIGSVIGSLAISRLPFIAIENPIIQKTTPDILLALFTATDDELKRMLKGVIYANFEPINLHKIKAPQIMNIERSITQNDEARVSLIFEDINIQQTMYADRSGIILKGDNIELSNGKWTFGHHMLSGDTLKLTHHMDCNLPKKQLEIFSNELKRTKK